MRLVMEIDSERLSSRCYLSKDAGFNMLDVVD